MSDTTINNSNFIDTYNRSCRLAAAVFIVADTLDNGQELKTIIKSLSLKLISSSVALKDISFSEARAAITEVEKNSMELLSMLDIAAVSDLISKMNANILREEFQAFLSELNKFKNTFGNESYLSVRKVFEESKILVPLDIPSNTNTNIAIPEKSTSLSRATEISPANHEVTSGNGHKRKTLRKGLIFEFIKGHKEVGIKDIVPNIQGCSEKTVQRELINLINEGKIKKTGERRWSRYSVV